MSKTLCIYHGKCIDGFGAAFAIRMASDRDIDFFEGIHQKTPPDVSGRDVIIVDFSYKREVIIDMAKEAKSILILDHHKSAATELVNLPANVTTHFNMEKSGVVLAWEHFHHHKKIPQLFLHIQDRDLYKFELEGTREIIACLSSYPYIFDVWEVLLGTDIQSLRQEGKAIERKYMKDILEFIDVASSKTVIAGYEVPILNAPYSWASDAGHIMSESQPFAACYYDTREGRIFSLRSDKDGLDVSEIAVKFGGGGHKHAAGFKLRYNELHRLGGKSVD